MLAPQTVAGHGYRARGRRRPLTRLRGSDPLPCTSLDRLPQLVFGGARRVQLRALSGRLLGRRSELQFPPKQRFTALS